MTWNRVSVTSYNDRVQGLYMKDQIEKTRKKNTSYTNYGEDDWFILSGNAVLSVLEFWRFCYGDLAGQSPMIAEFLVAKSLGIEKAENVTY